MGLKWVGMGGISWKMGADAPLINLLIFFRFFMIFIGKLRLFAKNDPPPPIFYPFSMQNPLILITLAPKNDTLVPKSTELPYPQPNWY
jgi:hypothetical protein